VGTHNTQFRYLPARWMQFVDGENLTIRAQEMLKSSGVDLAESRNHKRDCFVWPGDNYAAFGGSLYLEERPIRSFYYTSAVGDEPMLRQIREHLWSLGFEPHVFKKAKRNVKAKGVDIALTKDMLSHAFRGNYSAAVLVAGDGDYVPLVEEVKRLGKQVFVNFINEFTHPDLRLAADHFVNIAQKFQNWARGQKEV
jgi:uncharacterized LabA/DUF88 family protein